MKIPTHLPSLELHIEASGWPEEPVLHALCEKAIQAAAKAANLSWPRGAELSLLFSDDARVCELNAKWRGMNKPTNVLSFPGEDIAPGEISGMLIGDLVFALETLQREAEAQEKTFEDHLIHLVAHGFLHLFGFDHLEDGPAEEMEALERKTLASLGIADPYD